MLTQLVGPSKAKELFFTGRRVQSDEALALGIFNNVFEDASFENEALAMAKQIASGPPIAIAFMKEHINRAVTGDLRSNLAMEADRLIRCAATSDHTEAVKAFMEKRTPVFTGE